MRRGLPVTCGECGGRLSVEMLDGAAHVACGRCRWMDKQPARARWRQVIRATPAQYRHYVERGTSGPVTGAWAPKRARSAVWSAERRLTAAQRRARDRKALVRFIKAGRA